jgi:hypothetical protein
VLIFHTCIFFFSCINKSENIYIGSLDLIDEFNKDAETAEKKYKGNVLYITGNVSAIQYPKDWMPSIDASSIIFGSTDTDGHLIWENITIDCFFNNIEVHGLQQGDKITIQGEYDKFITSWRKMIRIKNSRIIKIFNGEVSTYSKP